MNCACGATFEPTRGRGRPRKRCRACAADQSRLGKEWRVSNPARVASYNAARRSEYTARHSVARARARLAYALKVRRRVAQAERELERLIAKQAA